MQGQKYQFARLGVAAGSLLLIALAPWWLASALIIVGIFAFERFVEGVALALLMDLLYGPSGHVGAFPFTLVAAILLIAAPYLKVRLVFWQTR